MNAQGTEGPQENEGVVQEGTDECLVVLLPRYELEYTVATSAEQRSWSVLHQLNEKLEYLSEILRMPRLSQVAILHPRCLQELPVG